MFFMVHLKKNLMHQGNTQGTPGRPSRKGLEKGIE